MRVTWICPTYGRPRMACNALSCFMSQDYPRDQLRLLIYDDLGSFVRPQPGDLPGVGLLMSTVRCPSLPYKYNRLWEYAAADPFDPQVIMVCEDDDVYLPWHTASVVDALKDGGSWAHPDRVMTDHTVRPGHRLIVQPVGSRFHACIAVTADALRECGGWIETDRGTFDQELIASLRKRFGPAKVPQVEPPQYIFRWSTTGVMHGQQLMRKHGEDWYRHFPVIDSRQMRLEPVYDPTTAAYYRRYANRLPAGRPA